MGFGCDLDGWRVADFGGGFDAIHGGKRQPWNDVEMDTGINLNHQLK